MINQKNRFHGHSSLNYVYRKGKTVRSKMWALKYANNKNRKNWRLAVVVSKKVEPTAVGRNRIRRRMFEAFRKNMPDHASHKDMVVTIYDKNVMTLESKYLEQGVKDLLTTVFGHSDL